MNNVQNINAKCSAISNNTFLDTPYTDRPGLDPLDLYKVNGFANMATGICHYCSISTLKSIIENGALRFSDIRFLNDSTEFFQAVPMTEYVLKQGNYSFRFKEFIRNSDTFRDLKNDKQLYVNSVDKIIYRTYTCSLSTDQNALGMWNYYAASSDGLNISFDHAWNIFKGDNQTVTNTKNIKLDNEILLSRGLILYNDDDKLMCIKKCLNQLYEVYELAQSEEEPSKFENNILNAFKQAINKMRCYFKDASFLPEKEYRITLMIPESLLIRKNISSYKVMTFGSFQRGNVLIPYIDYKIRKESIQQIVVNPYIKGSQTLFELGIKELLWSNGLENVPVVQSSIPLRNYN